MNKHWKTVANVVDELKDFTGASYPHGIFVSHPCSRYQKAEQKIFYCGQDTYWWLDKEVGGFDGMKELFRSGDWLKYKKFNSWPHTADDILQWGNRITFWPFVVKFHLYHTRNKFFKSVYEIDVESKNALMEIGYGNLHSVEVPRTLINEGCEPDDWLKYHTIATASEKIDKLKFVLDEYKPDAVVVLCWSWSESSYFTGLEPVFYPLYEKDGRRFAYYTFKGYKTKLICLDHPQSRRFPKSDFEGMIRLTSRLLNKWPYKPLTD